MLKPKQAKDLGPVARILVSANRWLRGIKTYRFPWYLTPVSDNHASNNPGLGPVSRKSQKCFGSEKPFVKLLTAYFAETIIQRVFKVTKRKMTVKLDDLNPLHSRDTKGMVTHENGP